MPLVCRRLPFYTLEGAIISNTRNKFSLEVRTRAVRMVLENEDDYSRKIVGWRVNRTPHTKFALDSLEQALHERRPTHKSGLVPHSDRSNQYVSIKYTERLAEAEIELPVGSVGDGYDNSPE